MPELPQMQALVERLGTELAGAALTGVEPLGFSALKTVVPPADSLVGAELEQVDRYAKYLILDFGAARPAARAPLAGGPARRRGAPEAHRAKGWSSGCGSRTGRRCSCVSTAPSARPVVGAGAG